MNISKIHDHNGQFICQVFAWPRIVSFLLFLVLRRRVSRHRYRSLGVCRVLLTRLIKTPPNRVLARCDNLFSSLFHSTSRGQAQRPLLRLERPRNKQPNHINAIDRLPSVIQCSRCLCIHLCRTMVSTKLEPASQWVKHQPVPRQHLHLPFVPLRLLPTGLYEPLLVPPMAAHVVRVPLRTDGEMPRAREKWRRVRRTSGGQQQDHRRFLLQETCRPRKADCSRGQRKELPSPLARGHWGRNEAYSKLKYALGCGWNGTGGREAGMGSDDESRTCWRGRFCDDWLQTLYQLGGGLSAVVYG